jgi:hypothetical protein
VNNNIHPFHDGIHLVKVFQVGEHDFLTWLGLSEVPAMGKTHYRISAPERFTQYSPDDTVCTSHQNTIVHHFLLAIVTFRIQPKLPALFLVYSCSEIFFSTIF